MRVVAELTRGSVPQAPRHSEVDQERTTGLEPDNQILAAAIDELNAFPLELRGDRRRIEGPRQPWVVDLDVLERAPDERRLELRAHRFDLG